MSQDDTPNLTRRRLLTRLGLAAGAAYVAPTMLHLTPASASGRSGYSRPSYSRPSFSRPSRGYRARDDRRYYERGGYIGPYRDRLTREERAAQYLLETLINR
jgi:hypothetical protein